MKHVYDMAWSPDNRMFAINSQLNENESNIIQAFDTKSLSRIWIAENTSSLNLAFNPNGQFIVESNPFVGILYLRSISQGNIVRQIKSSDCEGGQSLIFTPNGNTLLVANTNELGGLNPSYTIYFSLWDIDTGQCENLLHYSGGFHLFDVDSSGNFIAYGNEGKDDAAVIWDMKKQAEVCRIKADFGRFVSGQSTLAVYRDQKIAFVDVLSCQEVHNLDVGQLLVPYLAFSSDGQWLAVIRQSIQILDPSTGRILSQIPLPNNAVVSTYNHALVFSPNGRYLLLRFSTFANNEYADKVQLWQLMP
jgi:WD40 repeat protein